MHARASSVHVTSVDSAGPAGWTAVQVRDRSGTRSLNGDQPVRATMLSNPGDLKAEGSSQEVSLLSHAK